MAYSFVWHRCWRGSSSWVCTWPCYSSRDKPWDPCLIYIELLLCQKEFHRNETEVKTKASGKSIVWIHTMPLVLLLSCSYHISRWYKLLLLSLSVKGEVTLTPRKYFRIYLRAGILISSCLPTQQYVLNDWETRSSQEVSNVITRLFMLTAISDDFSENQWQRVVMNKNDMI